ncbi:MAG: replicative DNA helicase [Limnochordaceae bacterium]|nr:replicative DNA helicase [Limnochordaceae bacterium]
MAIESAVPLSRRAPGQGAAVAPEARGSFVPFDPDAERRVLGILLKYPDKADLVMDRLRAAHFYDRVHRAIYRIIEELYHSTGRISFTQVFNRLRKEPDVPDPEGALLELTDSFGTAAELEPAVDVLLDKQARRRILEAAQRIEQMILFETTPSLTDCQSQAQQWMFEATSEEGALEEDIKPLRDVLARCYFNLVERSEGKRNPGLNVSFPSIDGLTTGFKKKDLIILAARPSMGKTALALNFAVHVARYERVPVLIFSLEMDDEQIGDRIVISELFRLQEGGSPITSFEYNTRLDPGKFARTQSIFNELHELPILVVDRRGLTAADIRAKARRVKATHKDLGLIVIDYLQLIRPPSEANKNWALVVGDIVRELRDLAGELDVPIILLSQLNRGVEARDNKRPVMSDLRDSGNIEEFADVVMFLYRDDYYHPDKAKEKGTEGVVEVIVAKQRRGPTGVARLRFIREYTRFVDLEEQE